MRNKLVSGWLMVSSILVCLSVGPGQASPTEIARARALLDQGKAAEAYEILAPLEATLAGDVNFDYLLGIAALDSGHPDKSTLALERVLAVSPDFAGARLDFARAYFALGNYPRAKTEFEIVLKLNPPATARVTVENYLSAIEQRAPIKRGGASGYIEALLGYDTNVNNAVSESQVFVPLFGTILALSPTNIETSDAYLGLGFGGQATQRLTPTSSVYVSADIKNRRHFDASEFDTINAELRTGVSTVHGADSYNVGLQLGRLYLDGQSNRNLLGLTAEWRRALTDKNQIGVFGQYSQLRYQDPTIEINDVNQVVAGLGWVHVLGDGGRSALFGSIFGGTEQETNGRPDGDKQLAGLRLGTQLLTGNKQLFSASFGAQYGKYSEENLAFLVKRKDILYDINVGYTWHPAPNWSLRPQLVHSRNGSTVPIYEYTRTDISFSVRRDFQ
jgi:tetratricopeptide (TPR) repeat protein